MRLLTDDEHKGLSQHDGGDAANLGVWKQELFVVEILRDLSGEFLKHKSGSVNTVVSSGRLPKVKVRLVAVEQKVFLILEGVPL